MKPKADRLVVGGQRDDRWTAASILVSNGHARSDVTAGKCAVSCGSVCAVVCVRLPGFHVCGEGIGDNRRGKYSIC